MSNSNHSEEPVRDHVGGDRSFPPQSNNPNSEFTTDLAAELDQVIQEFDQTQSDLHYQQAQTVLQRLVTRMDLTPREKVGLEQSVAGLTTMLERLDRQVIQIAVFGMVGRGKSSLLNALLGESVFLTGPTHGVTQTIQQANWTVQPQQDPLQPVSIRLSSSGQSCIELIDTPGIDEVNGETREILAQTVAQQADLILFVVSSDLSRVEFESLSRLCAANKPLIVVFNKIDQYSPSDQEAIAQTLQDRVRSLVNPDDIVAVAASPLVRTAIRQADGQLKVHHRRSTPQVEPLKLKILEVLHRDGKSLVALNSMLYAHDVNEQVVERKLQIRDRSANDLIWSAATAKAMAIALNPITGLDMLGGAIIDVVMILALSKIYGLSMSQQGAVALLQRIAISMGSITAAEFLTTLGLSSLKGLLTVATPATGGLSLTSYLPVALAQAGVAGVSAYGIGQISKVYLAQGASWGNDDPKVVIRDILDSLDEESVLTRIKAELQAKLRLEDLQATPSTNGKSTA